MIELLAPVGSREALIAAIESGADAVYLAGKAFGARAYAPNFDDEQLAEGVRLAHLRGVKVYVTVNTLIDNSEIKALISYLQYIYKIGVDAIIVQDVAVIKIAQEVIPDMPIHASTQMTVHNLEGVKFLANIGVERVVLSREVSLKDLDYICKNSDTEIEAFVHGALCISYSGQCLMSSMIGGRSGNRGRCAQPCRLPYSLVDKKGNDVLADKDTGEYLLSPRDLNTLALLPELINAGVTSFKIEGRMKRPEYVAIVVDTYRRAIDAYLADKNNYIIDNQEQKDLAQIFNRDFTTAYLEKKQGRNMMSDRRPNNRGVRIGRVTQYNYVDKTVSIKLDEPLHINDIVDFWVKVGGRVSTTVSDIVVKGKSVDSAPAGTEITIPITSPVRVNDRVFKVFDARLMERARAFFNSDVVRRVPVNITVSVSEGQPLVIAMQDADGYCGQAATNFLAEKAIKRPLSMEVLQKQLTRLGNTIFSLEKLECNITGEVMVPISEINDARRRAVEALEDARLARFNRRPLIVNNYSNDIMVENFVTKIKQNKRPALVINVDTIEKLQAGLKNGADIVLFGGEAFNHQLITQEIYGKAVNITREYNKKIILNTPRIVKQWQMNGLESDIKYFHELQPDAIGISNLGVLEMVRNITNLPLHGDYSLNIYNNLAVKFYEEQGFASLTLSPEMNIAQIEQIAFKSKAALECLVHGYVTLMVSEYCTMGSYLGDLHTGKCSQACLKGEFWLKDRKNEQFPVVTDQFCRMHVLNAKELSMLPHVPKFSAMGIDRIRIEGKKGSAQYLGKITRLYRELIDQGEKHSLLQQDNFKSVEHDDITRGHYFRGVL